MCKIILRKLFGKYDEAIEEARAKSLREHKRSAQELETLNKRFKLLLDEGNVEIIIKNVKGVLQDDPIK